MSVHRLGSGCERGRSSDRRMLASAGWGAHPQDRWVLTSSRRRQDRRTLPSVNLSIAVPNWRQSPGSVDFTRQQRALVAYFVLVLAGVAAAALLVARFPSLLPIALILLLASWIPNIVGILVTAR